MSATPTHHIGNTLRSYVRFPYSIRVRANRSIFLFCSVLHLAGWQRRLNKTEPALRPRASRFLGPPPIIPPLEWHTRFPEFYSPDRSSIHRFYHIAFSAHAPCLSFFLYGSSGKRRQRQKGSASTPYVPTLGTEVGRLLRMEPSHALLAMRLLNIASIMNAFVAFASRPESVKIKSEQVVQICAAGWWSLRPCSCFLHGLGEKPVASHLVCFLARSETSQSKHPHCKLQCYQRH